MNNQLLVDSNVYEMKETTDDTSVYKDKAYYPSSPEQYLQE